MTCLHSENLSQRSQMTSFPHQLIRVLMGCLLDEDEIRELELTLPGRIVALPFEDAPPSKRFNDDPTKGAKEAVDQARKQYTNHGFKIWRQKVYEHAEKEKEE